MMSALRWAAAVLLALGGFCLGDARCQRFSARRRALEKTVGLLLRLRQEIACLRTDLNTLYRRLGREYEGSGALGASMRRAESFASLLPPACLRPEEAACFTECLSALGHNGATQECVRLDYYIQRFEGFLAQAKEDEKRSAGLDRRLGLAAGAVLGLFVL